MCHRHEGHDLKQTSTGVFRPFPVTETGVPCRQASREQTRMRLTSLGQETQLGVLRTPRSSLYTRVSTNVRKHNQLPRLESPRPQVVSSYRVLSHTTPYHVILRHATSCKSGIPSHCKPSICVWAPVSPPSYPRPVWPPRRSWSR